MATFTIPGLFKEARRRRVFRIIALYIVGAWATLQVADLVFQSLDIPATALRHVWIGTILGFPLAVVIGWRYDIVSGRIVRTAAATGHDNLPIQKSDYFIFGILTIVLIAISVGSVTEILRTQPIANEQTRASIDVDPRSVAVMPFVNMSNDLQNEYFSDGLTETLLHMLAQLPDLKVSARTSAFAFKNKNIDIRSIAESLGVAHVLEGSVQKAGDRVRITAQLIRADDGFHVWSQRYDRTLDDIFAIQDEISNDVAAALGSSLLTAQDGAIQGVDTEDLTAYDIFLRALEQQNISTIEALLNAEGLFKEALDKDPDFLDAKIGLARNYLWQVIKNENYVGEEYAAAKSLLEEILAQRPGHKSAQAMYLLNQFYFGYAECNCRDGSDETLEALLDEMLLLADQGNMDPYVIRDLTEVLGRDSRNRNEEALEMVRAALLLDPLNFELLWAQGTVYSNIDRPEEARQSLLAAQKLAPENPEIYWSLGAQAKSEENFVEALNWWRQAAELDTATAFFASVIAEDFLLFGLASEGRYWLDNARAIDPDEPTIYILEMIYTELAGDTDQLLELTKSALSLSSPEWNNVFPAILYYSWTMSKAGQSQQALEYLAGLLPGLLDFTELAGGYGRHTWLQSYAWHLQSDLMDQDSYRQLTETFINAFVTAGLPGRENTFGHIEREVARGNLVQAREIFLEIYESWEERTFEWYRVLGSPWLEEFRQDPEVAVVLEQYLQKQARIREELEEMLQQPEWRH